MKVSIDIDKVTDIVEKIVKIINDNHMNGLEVMLMLKFLQTYHQNEVLKIFSEEKFEPEDMRYIG